MSWNTHIGAGDVDSLVADLRAGRLTAGAPVTDFILLLQEVHRAGRGDRNDIVSIFARLGLHAIYIPSMRNGGSGATGQDRGNAVLATVPLSSVTAIELPLERQRRVAIQAVVHAATGDGGATPITIVDTHFTNMVMHHLWILSESGRFRQARALGRVLPADGPLIIGGDFNAWFGFRDAAYRELGKIAGPAGTEDRRASFGPLRLDHLLFRLPGWKTTLRRADSRYGSDHYPLVATADKIPGG